LHKVDKTLVFDTWQDLLAASDETISTIGKRLADAVIIAVQDHLHAEVTAAFAKQGYHILCEKPRLPQDRDVGQASRKGIWNGAWYGGI